MSHKGWRRSIYTAWSEVAHITIASLKGLMSFFHNRLFIIFPPAPSTGEEAGGRRILFCL